MAVVVIAKGDACVEEPVISRGMLSAVMMVLVR